MKKAAEKRLTKQIAKFFHAYININNQVKRLITRIDGI